MSLPFTVSTSAMPQGPPAPRRPGASAPSLRPAALPQARPPAATRVDKTPVLSPAKGTGALPPATGHGGFASVLASVQQQDESTAAAPEDVRRASATDRVPSSERDAADRVGESAAAEHVVADAPPPPSPAPTPWLLLSLSSGPHAWNSGSESSPEALGEAGDTSAAPAATHALVVHAADLGAMPITAPALIVDGGALAAAEVAALPGAPAPVGAPATGGPMGHQDGGIAVEPGTAPLRALTAAGRARPATMEASLPAPAAMETGAVIAVPAAASAGVDGAIVGAPVIGPAEVAAPVTAAPAPTAAPPTVAAPPVAERAAAGPTIDTVVGLVRSSGEGPTAEVPPDLTGVDERPARSSTATDALGRWLSATRRTGGDVEGRLPGVAETPSATGLAVRQLAHVVGSARSGEATDDGAPAVPLILETLTSPVAGGMPTARASEVLLRLAQAGATGARPGRDPQTPAAVAVQMVSPALASPTVAEPVMAAAPAAPLPPDVGDQVMQQVVRSMRLQWKDGIGEAKLHLRPDALGSVSVSLRVEAGAVTAVVRAESPQVQEWILQHQQTLRQQMEHAGLRLDELVVSSDDQRQPDQQQEAPPEQRRRARGTRADAAMDSMRFEQLL